MWFLFEIMKKEEARKELFDMHFRKKVLEMHYENSNDEEVLTEKRIIEERIKNTREIIKKLNTEQFYEEKGYNDRSR